MTQVLPDTGVQMKNSFVFLVSLISLVVFSPLFSSQVFAQERLHVSCMEGWLGDPDDLSDRLIEANIIRSGDAITVRSVQSERRHYEFRFNKGMKDGQVQWTMIVNTWMGECLLERAFTLTQQKKVLLNSYGYFDMVIEGAPFEYGISGDLTVVNRLEVQCNLTVGN